MAALLALVGIPLAQLFATALGDGMGPAWQALTGAGTSRAVLNTLWTSAVITVLAVAGGAAAAFVTERSEAPGRHWLRFALIGTLLSAPLVSALGWARAYGPGGL